MSYPGPTTTKFGRYAVADPQLFATTFHRPTSNLKKVSWTIPIPVLDQEDLTAQGIDTAKVVKGAATVDALGSCTANATTASYAERNDKGFLESNATAADYEVWAIQFYNACTDQTGDPSQEWPPTDCGSTGLYCCTELQHMGKISSFESGSDVQQLLSMLQQGSVIQGSPFFNSWMQPDAQGFIDGNGSMASFEAAMDSGVAGGHETCVYAIEAIDSDLKKTVLRVRNSWSTSWGIDGDYRIHASTLDWLARYSGQIDWRLFVVGGK